METDPVLFLANIVLVAHSNGKLSSSELSQLESVRTELKLKKNDLNAAIKLVKSGNHQMTPVGSFVNQVRNLELILKVAYTDNDLDEIETSYVNEFSHAAGIYQDQLEKIRQEVMFSLKTRGKLCSSCGAESDAESLFCSKCGKSLDLIEDEGQKDLNIPGSGIAIEFAESTAASFPKALEIAKAADDFQSCQREKKFWYLAVYKSGNMTDAIPLCLALSGLRNRRVYIEGKDVLWDEVFGFVWCAERRATAYRPIEYCFGNDENRLNPWGCRQSNMEWSEWAQWFRYGNWEKTGIFGGKIQWRFDKERIQHELATNLFRYRFCPHLMTNLSAAVLKHLPETVMPEKDPNWGYRKSYEQVPGSIKMIEKRDSCGYSITDEYWANGVCPKGGKVLAEILTKALQDLGGSPLLVHELIK